VFLSVVVDCPARLVRVRTSDEELAEIPRCRVSPGSFGGRLKRGHVVVWVPL